MPAPNENYGSGGRDSIQFGEGWHPLLLELRLVPIGIGNNDLPGGNTSHMLGDRRQKIGQRTGLGEIDTRPASFIVQMGIREAGRDKAALQVDDLRLRADRSEEHTSELQSLMRISYAVLCLKKTKYKQPNCKR